jgi:hypothetical protein
LILPLLSEEAAQLPSEILAVYIQAASKIFGRWAAELAERWDEDELPAVKEIASLIIARLSMLSASPHIEVQERVCHIHVSAHENAKRSCIFRLPMRCNSSTLSAMISRTTVRGQTRLP